jgi:hypothetical protein
MLSTKLNIHFIFFGVLYLDPGFCRSVLRPIAMMSAPCGIKSDPLSSASLHNLEPLHCVVMLSPKVLFPSSAAQRMQGLLSRDFPRGPRLPHKVEPLST